MKDVENTTEFTFLELNEGDNIYDVCSFGICGDYPTAYIMNDKSVYRLPKAYKGVCEFFLLMPPTLPAKVNFIKEGDTYNIEFMED